MRWDRKIRYEVTRWATGVIERAASETLIWVLIQKARWVRGWNPADENMPRMIRREVGAIMETVEAGTSWQMNEQEVLKARLGRRYDLGMALNESANRALEAKAQAAVEAPILTTRQEAALKFQKDYLQRVVKNS